MPEVWQLQKQPNVMAMDSRENGRAVEGALVALRADILRPAHFTAACRVEYIVDGRRSVSFLCDLSSRDMTLRSAGSLAAGDTLEFVLRLDDGGSPLEIVGQVAAKPNDKEALVAFVFDTGLNRPRLLEYIESHLVHDLERACDVLSPSVDKLLTLVAYYCEVDRRDRARTILRRGIEANLRCVELHEQLALLLLFEAVHSGPTGGEIFADLDQVIDKGRAVGGAKHLEAIARLAVQARDEAEGQRSGNEDAAVAAGRITAPVVAAPPIATRRKRSAAGLVRAITSSIARRMGTGKHQRLVRSRATIDQRSAAATPELAHESRELERFGRAQRRKDNLETHARSAGVESLELGIDSLDEDHDLLLRLNKLLSVAASSGEGEAHVESIANLLFDYTLFHFRREERVMEACGYSGLRQHRAIHAEIVDKVEAVRRSADWPSNNLAVELSSFVQDWVTTHVAREDQKFRPVLANNLEAATAAAGEILMVPDLLGSVPDGSAAANAVPWSEVAVLLAEPSRELRGDLKTMLYGVGLSQVYEAASCEEVEQILRRQDVNAILCSDTLRDGDCSTILRLADRHAAKLMRPCPTVIITSDARSDWKRQVLSAGAIGFLYRPLSAGFLFAAVSRAVTHSLRNTEGWPSSSRPSNASDSEEAGVAS